MVDTKTFFIREKYEADCLQVMGLFGYKLVSKQFVFDKVAESNPQRICKEWWNGDDDLRVFDLSFSADINTPEEKRLSELCTEYLSLTVLPEKVGRAMLPWGIIFGVIALIFLIAAIPFAISGDYLSLLMPLLNLAIWGSASGLFLGLHFGKFKRQNTKNKQENLNIRKRKEEIMNEAKTTPVFAPETQKVSQTVEKTKKEQLLEAQQLLEEGLITSEEYEIKRKKILGI